MNDFYRTPKEILFIDDDEEEYAILNLALAEINPLIKLTHAKTCSKALYELEDCSPDLIFLDINMPQLNGIECITKLKESASYCQVPIVIYSGSNAPRDIKASGQQGADLFFIKALSFQELLSSLQEILSMGWFLKDRPQYKVYTKGQYQDYDLAS